MIGRIVPENRTHVMSLQRPTMRCEDLPDARQ